jgi:hypothetical protein
MCLVEFGHHDYRPNIAWDLSQIDSNALIHIDIFSGGSETAFQLEKRVEFVIDLAKE